MTKKQQTILLSVLGVVVVLLITCIAVGVWVATSLFDNESMDDSVAALTFEEVRAHFAGTTPVIDLRPQGAVLIRRPPQSPPPRELKTLHVLRWDVHEKRMTRVELPFAFLRISDSVFPVSLEPQATGLRVKTSVKASEIERFGPALLVDNDLPDGGRLLVWSD